MLDRDPDRVEQKSRVCSLEVAEHAALFEESHPASEQKSASLRSFLICWGMGIKFKWLANRASAVILCWRYWLRRKHSRLILAGSRALKTNGEIARETSQDGRAMFLPSIFLFRKDIDWESDVLGGRWPAIGITAQVCEAARHFVQYVDIANG